MSVRISVESLSGCAWNGCPSQRGIRIHTSAIVQAEREGPFWVLHTLSGSFYVILSFNILKGAQSLDDYLHRMLTMEYPEPWQLH